MTKKESLEKNGINFKLFELRNEYSAKNILLAMDEYAEYVAEKAWKIAKDYGFDLAGEWAIGKKCERITFEDWFEQFKAKENE
jgi:hypothetical protein